jgi:hypothetical protein
MNSPDSGPATDASSIATDALAQASGAAGKGLACMVCGGSDFEGIGDGHTGQTPGSSCRREVACTTCGLVYSFVMRG